MEEGASFIGKSRTHASTEMSSDGLDAGQQIPTWRKNVPSNSRRRGLWSGVLSTRQARKEYAERYACQWLLFLTKGWGKR